LSLLFFEFSVLYVSSLQLHVNDADLLVNQDIFGRASCKELRDLIRLGFQGCMSIPVSPVGGDERASEGKHER
jgi:hypothetical protein